MWRSYSAQVIHKRLLFLCKSALCYVVDRTEMNKDNNPSRLRDDRVVHCSLYSGYLFSPYIYREHSSALVWHASEGSDLHGVRTICFTAPVCTFNNVWYNATYLYFYLQSPMTRMRNYNADYVFTLQRHCLKITTSLTKSKTKASLCILLKASCTYIIQAGMLLVCT